MHTLLTLCLAFYACLVLSWSPSNFVVFGPLLHFFPVQGSICAVFSIKLCKCLIAIILLETCVVVNSCVCLYLLACQTVCLAQKLGTSNPWEPRLPGLLRGSQMSSYRIVWQAACWIAFSFLALYRLGTPVHGAVSTTCGLLKWLKRCEHLMLSAA